MATVIGLRSHHITWSEYKIPHGQSTNYAANQMRLLPNGNIQVRTLYRYGKDVIKEYTPSEFNQWQAQVDRLAA